MLWLKPPHNNAWALNVKAKVKALGVEAKAKASHHCFLSTKYEVQQKMHNFTGLHWNWQNAERRYITNDSHIDKW